jgi:CheY-like chemotaxis protein
MSVSVLVVEDDPNVRLVLDELLHDQGLDVWLAPDDLTAYQVLSQEAGRFAVLLTDINLGAGSDGFDVARRARCLNADIKVIFISAFPIDSRRFAREGGMFLAKPLDLGVLAEMVRAVAAKALN